MTTARHNCGPQHELPLALSKLAISHIQPALRTADVANSGISSIIGFSAENQTAASATCTP